MAIVGKVGSESSEPLKAYHIGFENTEDTLATTSSRIGTHCIDGCTKGPPLYLQFL